MLLTLAVGVWADAPNKWLGRAMTIAHLNCSVLTVLTLPILLTIRAGVLWDTRGITVSWQQVINCSVPANISATLFSQRSTQHSLNISRKSLFEEEFSARMSVFVYYF